MKKIKLLRINFDVVTESIYNFMMSPFVRRSVGWLVRAGSYTSMLLSEHDTEE